MVLLSRKEQPREQSIQMLESEASLRIIACFVGAAGTAVTVAGRCSLNQRLFSGGVGGGVVGSAAAAQSAATKPDVLAWWKLHLRVHAAHLLVHLADAALLTVTGVGLAPDRRAFEANRLHAATHLARRETERIDVRSARLLYTEASHARVHVLLHLRKLIAGRHAVKRLTQASRGLSMLNGLSQK